MRDRLIKALDDFESSLKEYCRTHTLNAKEVYKGKQLVKPVDQKAIKEELTKLQRLERLKGRKYGTAH
jgi:hypothetical protein